MLSAVVLGACGDSPLESSADAPLAAKTARFTIASVTLTPPAALAGPGKGLAIGATAKFTATARDGRGRPINQANIRWWVTGDAASVSSAGDVTAAKEGPVTVHAEADGHRDEHEFTVTGAPVPAPDPAPADSGAKPDTTATPVPPAPLPLIPPASGAPSSPTSIAAAIVRFDGSSGETVVSSGVPLMPGALRGGQESYVHVFVNGVEQPAHVAALSGTHADGSLRAVLVQVRATASTGQALPARIEIGGSARTADHTSPVLATPGSVPGSALLPTDATYLVGTDIVGATTTSAAASALGGTFARYEADFAPAADAYWSREGDHYDGNYYDRALIYFAQWARTGNPTYWYRGARQAVAYRRGYLEANNFGASPHWAQLEGLEKHYLLTGDDASRYAIARTANAIWSVWSFGRVMNGDMADPRINGRVLLGQLLAWRLGGHPAVAVESYGGGGSTYESHIDLHLSAIASWQVASGATAGVYPSGPLFCGGQYNFMAGVLNDALVKTHSYYRADGRIVSIVKRSLDYMWNTQWTPGQGFNYGDIPNCDGGGAYPAGDLTGLIVAPFAWVAKQTGDGAYRARGDEAFASGVSHGVMYSSKHFNQAYATSWRYFGWR